MKKITEIRQKKKLLEKKENEADKCVALKDYSPLIRNNFLVVKTKKKEEMKTQKRMEVEAEEEKRDRFATDALT